MLHRASVVIPDIYADPRVPADAYRPTFVKSLAMVPVRHEDPIGAIGAYWAEPHEATARELTLLQTLANATSVALANTELFAKAAEAIRIRDEFMAVASHELRTPLTALKLQIQGLQELEGQPDLDARRGQRLQRANRQIERLSALVEQLLDASYLGSSQIGLNPEPFDLLELVHETVQRLRDVARRARCDVVIQAPASLPAVSWDRIRIDQVLESLLSNALKYGQGKPVEIQLERSADVVQVSVIDQGIGLDPKDSERIFGRFERAVSSRHYGGLGLGLYIANRIVLAHGGHMRVESAPERGATFTIALPIEPAAASS